MNLQTTNTAIVSILKALGLNPKTVPESEMLAESFFLRNCITSECVRISHGGSNFFQMGNEPKIPCIDILLQTDDTIDGLGDTFCFSYYGGDNIPAGPRHGLVITNLNAKTLLYWRDRYQSPTNEWKYNVFARAQMDFKFSPQGNDPRFMTRQSLYEFMRGTLVSDTTHPTVAEYLKVDDSSQLLAEVAYLNFWNYNNGNAPAEEGIDFNVTFDYANDTVIITISCDHREDIEAINLLYTINSETEEPHPNFYELLVLDGDNVVYERNFDQDEASQWNRNSMANDPFVTDENGNPLFVGEPIQE